MLRPLSATLSIAVALAAPAAARAAPTDADMQTMQQRVQALEARLEQMQKLLDQRAPGVTPAAAAASSPGTPAWGDPAQTPARQTQAELDALKQKVARQELTLGKLYSDAFESAGSGLEVSGYIDPTYVYNRNQRSSSFQFLDGGDPYTYDNSQNGDVFLRIVKTFGEGLQAPKIDLQIAPSRGNGVYNTASDGSVVTNLFHQALMTVPVNDTTAVLAGFSAGYAGYEYYESTLTQTVSHNLLFDFSAPGSMVGVGVSYANTQGTLLAKAFIGNEEYYTNGSSSYTFRNRSPSLMARVDYGVDSALWVGGSLYLGRNTLYGPYVCPEGQESYGYQCASPGPYATKAYLELDLSYQSADVMFNAQADVGTLQRGAWNGGRATWWGLSGLAHRKWFSTLLGRVGATVRLDYLNNQRNGGGNSNLYIDGDYPGTDPLNGFGIAPDCYAADVDGDGNSLNGRNCKGANRYALTLAFLVYPSDRWTLKSELRHDLASERVFSTNTSIEDGLFRRRNSGISLQSVYAF